MGTPDVDICVAASRLDPLLGNEKLTTEGLTAAIYGRIFAEPHMDEVLFQIIREVAEIAGAGLTGAVVSAAKAATRRGFVGATGRLAGDILLQVNWDRPSVYLELRRGETFIVLRVEGHPVQKGKKFAWIHEIQATAQEAIDILGTLAASWPSLGLQHAMKSSSGRLTEGESRPRRRAAA
jgi:hypothetical protein